MAGAGRFRRACAAQLRWATRASQVVGPGSMLGFAGAAVALHVQRHVAVQPWHWIVVGPAALGGVGAGGCANAMGSEIETGSGPDATLPRAPAVDDWTRPAAPTAVGEQGAVHTQPRSSAHTTCTPARRQPGPQPWSTATTRAAWVHLRGAAAGR